MPLPVDVSMRLRKAPVQKIFEYGGMHGYSDDLLKLLSAKDKTGIYIVNAGDGNWKNFDYKKGYEELIKKQSSYELYMAGKHWNWDKFPRKEALEFLKSWSGNIYEIERAKKEWPLDIEGAEEKSREIKMGSKKLPTKKLKLENVLTSFIKERKEKNPLAYIYYRFCEGDISLDQAIRETEKLAEKYGHYNKIYDEAFPAGDNIESLVYLIGMSSARRLDKDPKYVEKLLPLLIKYDKSGSYVKRAADHWGGKVADIMLAYSDKIKKASVKMPPSKKLKLD
jgi:hypothetical protein